MIISILMEHQRPPVNRPMRYTYHPETCTERSLSIVSGSPFNQGMPDQVRHDTRLLLTKESDHRVPNAAAKAAGVYHCDQDKQGDKRAKTKTVQVLLQLLG